MTELSPLLSSPLPPTRLQIKSEQSSIGLWSDTVSCNPKRERIGEERGRGVLGSYRHYFRRPNHFPKLLTREVHVSVVETETDEMENEEGLSVRPLLLIFISSLPFLFLLLLHLPLFSSFIPFYLLSPLPFLIFLLHFTLLVRPY